MNVFLAAIFSLAVVMNVVLSRAFPHPYPPARLSRMPEYAVLDLAGIVGGLRRLAADIAWIQLLQYYGSSEEPLDKEDEFRLSWGMTRFLLTGKPIDEPWHGEHKDKQGHDHEPARTAVEVKPHAEHQHAEYDGGNYPRLLDYCYRIADLDPFFSYMYLYGAGSLAWNVQRPEQGLELLKHGIDVMERFRRNSSNDHRQPYWQYNLYIGAIIYRKAGDLNNMVTLLEPVAHQKTTPAMVKGILAGIYQKQGRLMEAIALWIEVYDSDDASYRTKAENKIAELRRLLGR